MRSFPSAFGTEAEIQTEIFLIEVNPRQWGERETPIAGLATTSAWPIAWGIVMQASEIVHLLTL
jgi:hypothetical protein